MRHIHRVLRCLLGVAGNADGPEIEVAPVGFVPRNGGQAPLRRSSLDPPPSKDQAVNFLCLEYFQLRVSWRVGIGCGNALAGCIVLKAVEGTNEAAVAYATSGLGTQIGAKVRAISSRYADPSAVVAPDDDFLSHPGLPDELRFQYCPTASDKVPTLRKRGGQRRVRHLNLSAGHRLTLLIRIGSRMC